MGYFKPWRRKIGVITLVLACVFGALWVLSFLGPIDVELSKERYYISFASGRITLVHLESDYDPSGERYNPWEWHFFGFSAEQEYVRKSVVNTRSIPIWIFLVPLTVLSAWSHGRRKLSQKANREQPE